uniref:EF-hand domain-containing protein n=1 Tax=Schistosoma mansoni TaxID=6183 RepID=A0A5K4FAY7_SCHMA
MTKIRRSFEYQSINLFLIYLILIHYTFSSNTGLLVGIPGLKNNKRTSLFMRNLLPTYLDFLHCIFYRSHHNYYDHHLCWNIYSDDFKSRRLDEYFNYKYKLYNCCNKPTANLCTKKYKKCLSDFQQRQQRQMIRKIRNSNNEIQRKPEQFNLHIFKPESLQYSKFNKIDFYKNLPLHLKNESFINIHNLIKSNRIILSKWLNQLSYSTNLTKIINLTEQFTHLILDLAYERIKLILLYEFQRILKNIFNIESLNEKYYTKSTNSKELWKDLVYNKLYAEYIFNEFDVPVSLIKPELIQSVFNEIDYNGDGIFTPSELEIFLQFHEIML